MKDTIEFRKINEIEKKIITNFFSNISVEFSKFIKNFKDYTYIITKSLNFRFKYPKIYIISQDQVNILKNLVKDNIISAGLYFGFIKKGIFYLSLEGAEFLYKNNFHSGLKKIQVVDKGEKSILYGNNIKKNMVKEIPNSLKQNELLLIINRTNEIIALAHSKINYQELQKLNPHDEVAINLIDKGFYLRVKQ